MLRPDPHSKNLMLELRDEATKTVSFALVSEGKAEVSWLDSSRHDKWWTGLEDFREGVAWLHGYEEEGLPLHQGLCGYDVDSKAMLWERPEAAYFGMVKDGILLEESVGDTQKVELLDIRTGQLRQTFENKRDPELTQALQGYEFLRNAQMQFPDMLQPEDSRFAHWKNRLGVEPFGPIWLAGYEGHQVLAWHEGSPADGFALAIALYRGDQLQLDGWLEENMKGMHPDPFFIHSGRVIAIRNRNELVIIPLTEKSN
jgi:hypothetical protein